MERKYNAMSGLDMYKTLPDQEEIKDTDCIRGLNYKVSRGMAPIIPQGHKPKEKTYKIAGTISFCIPQENFDEEFNVVLRGQNPDGTYNRMTIHKVKIVEECKDIENGFLFTAESIVPWKLEE